MTGFVMLLPSIEQDSLFKLYNPARGPGGTDTNGGGGQDQAAFKAVRVPLFVCPSDAVALARPRIAPCNGPTDSCNTSTAQTSSYCFNRGRARGSGRYDYFARNLASRSRARVGPFAAVSTASVADILDGTANTFLFRGSGAVRSRYAQ